MSEQNKEISVTLTFKQMVLDLSGSDFKAAVDDTIVAMKTRLEQIHMNYQATKAATIAGEEKGVELSVKITF